MYFYLILIQIRTLTYTAKVQHNSLQLTFSANLNGLPQVQLYTFQHTKLIDVPVTSNFSNNIMNIAFTNPFTFQSQMYLLFKYPYLVFQNGNTSNVLTNQFRQQLSVPGTNIGLELINIIVVSIAQFSLLLSYMIFKVSEDAIGYYIFVDYLQVIALFYYSKFFILKDSRSLLYYLQPVLGRFPYFDFYGLGTWWQQVQISLPIFVLALILLILGCYTSFIHNNPIFKPFRFGLPLRILIFLCPGLVQSSMIQLVSSWSNMAIQMIIAKVVSILLILFYIWLVCLCFFLLWSKMYGLQTDQIKETYGILYRGLNTNSFFSRNLWNIQFCKRLILALIISARIQTLQYLKFMSATLLQALIFLMIVYSSPLQNKNNYFLLILVLLSIFQKLVTMILWLSNTIIPDYQPDIFPSLQQYFLTSILGLMSLILILLLIYEIYFACTQTKELTIFTKELVKEQQKNLETQGQMSLLPIKQD